MPDLHHYYIRIDFGKNFIIENDPLGVRASHSSNMGNLLNPAHGGVVTACSLRKGLADQIDLVVVSATGKSEQFHFECRQPWRRAWEVDQARLHFGRLDRHARQFVALRLYSYPPSQVGGVLRSALFADARIFDQDLHRFVPLRQVSRLCF